ncbi:PREDICTED: choline transporter-like protein 1 [Camelina sativa]|uniref:Choline transporter-like protein n=1 Tax=Camelina sativa TaxID=90675 RepID=A0ABM0UU18_CAMSA|nr:PREDICTED: choline transporter-like protein 1 [Camelina sativa]
MAADDGDPSKFAAIYDSSSPSHPLLSKPSTSALDSPRRSDPESDPTQFLQISYNFGPRPFKDIPFLLLFDLLVLSTFAFGIFSVFHRNSDYGSSSSSFTYDFTSSSCVKNSTFGNNASSSVMYGLLSSSDSVFEKNLIWTLVVTLILSAPFCFSVLLLLKHYTKQIVYACLPLFVLFPIFFNVYWFVACTLSSSCSHSLPLAYRILVLVFVFLVIGIIVWIIVWIIVGNWHIIELTIQIIGVASDALSKNLKLFLVLPLLTLGLVLYYAPIVVFLVFARFNGKFVPRELDGDYFCEWKEDSWVPAYYALAILTMLWSLAVMVEMQVYVISGAIAQWYFSKEESIPKKCIRSSLRNAFGQSFGTICVSGLLICIVRVVRAIVDNAREENPQGMVNLVLRCCANALLGALDYLNKFTINFAAITGEAYCTSAKMTYELLRRNLLSAVFVETVSTRILTGIVSVLSAAYAVATWGVLRGVSNLGKDSYLVAILAWVLLIVILAFFVHVLDDVIDTIYVCYAIDRDKGDVCKQEVHEVYVHLPISRSTRSPLIPNALNA